MSILRLERRMAPLHEQNRILSSEPSETLFSCSVVIRRIAAANCAADRLRVIPISSYLRSLISSGQMKFQQASREGDAGMHVSDSHDEICPRRVRVISSLRSLRAQSVEFERLVDDTPILGH